MRWRVLIQSGPIAMDDLSNRIASLVSEDYFMLSIN